MEIIRRPGFVNETIQLGEMKETDYNRFKRIITDTLFENIS